MPSVLVVLLGAAIVPAAFAQSAPRSHADLDWKAPYRWVHVDNLDAAKEPRFESARKEWLQALRNGGSLLGDGRPLFWHARSSPAGQTLFTFYPFRVWADLDARRQMIDRTQKKVGDAALKAYDAGDEALVSPHYSQIWHREPDYDIAAGPAKDLTELTAMAGRLEVHDMDVRGSEDFDRAWTQVADALAAASYPLACRVYTTTYGSGEAMIWWLAKDAAAYRQAPALRAALEKQLGKKEAGRLLDTIKRTAPVKESYEVERRPDLSNLGK